MIPKNHEGAVVQNLFCRSFYSGELLFPTEVRNVAAVRPKGSEGANNQPQSISIHQLFQASQACLGFVAARIRS